MPNLSIDVKDSEARADLADLENYVESIAPVALSATENGTYTAPTGVFGYSPVSVNVASGLDYSTTEQDTCIKWIDGKPIYQKTFTNAFSGLFTHTIWHNLSNVSISDIDSCIDVKVSCHDTYGGGSNVAFLNAYYFRINNGTVQLYSFEDWNILIDAITIWYTKTTDTVE